MERVPSLRDSVKSGARGADPVAARPEDRIDVRASFPAIAATVSICGAASNAGKTWLCESVLRGLSSEGRRTCALKVTRTHLGDCPRGITTCGTCDSVKGSFEIVREPALLDVPGKDTGRYRAAGADQVLWLLVKPSSMRDGILAALAHVADGSVLVAEGNSFGDYASADVALLALARNGELKPSARHVIDRVDACVAPHAAPARPSPSAGLAAPRPASAPVEKPVIDADAAWTFVREKLAAARAPRPAGKAPAR